MHDLGLRSSVIVNHNWCNACGTLLLLSGAKWGGALSLEGFVLQHLSR